MERVDDILAPAGEALADHLVVGGVHVHNLQNDQRILAVIEGKATYCLQKIISKNPVLGRVSPKGRNKKVTRAVHMRFCYTFGVLI
jgi:dTDP-4-dehydrorhamnose 3,5-epimerase-like enzyme